MSNPAQPGHADHTSAQPAAELLPPVGPGSGPGPGPGSGSGPVTVTVTGSGLLERIASPANLRQAWDAVRSRRGGPGVDRVRWQDYAEGSEARLLRLGERLLAGSYRPSAVLRCYPAHDPTRPLSIPTIEDRIVQRAVAAVIGPLLEPTFSPAAWAYRPGRSVDRALRVVERYLEQGLRYFLRTDIEKFFDRIDQDPLARELAADIADERVLALVGRLVRAQVLEGAASDLMELGVPQGSALSPLLSNVYLRSFDEQVLAAGYPLVRYADDMLVLCRSFEQTAEALDLLSRTVEELGLRLGPSKTRRGHLGEGFVFLGVHYGAASRGPSKHALRGLSERAAALLSEACGPAEAAGELGGLAACWEEYHGPLAPGDVPDLPMLLGCLLQPGTSQGERIRQLAARRRTLLLTPEGAPCWLHLALVEAWAAAGQSEALLFDATAAMAAAGKRGLAPADRARLLAALAVPEAHAADVLDALAHAPVGLAAALGRAGRTELADAVRSGLLGGEGTGGRKGGDQAAAAGRQHGPAERASPALLERLGELFAGREGVHAALLGDRRGHRRFFPVQQPLGSEQWAEHLAGRASLGLFVVRVNGAVRVAAITASLERNAAAQAEQLHTLQGLVADAAARVHRAAEKLGLATLIEDRGPQQRRVWLLFAAPLLLRDVRALVVRLANEAGPATPPLRLELMPEVDRLRHPPGPLLPLPLGLLPRGGGFSTFVDAAGRRLADLQECLASLRPAPPQLVHDLVRRGPLAADRGWARGEPVEALLRDLPRVLRITKGCAVLRGLIEKARDLGQLDGYEICSLHELLGHVPAEGRESLVRVLERAGRDAREVDRRLGRLPPMPISCVRLRSRHPRLSVAVACDCRFGGMRLGANSYPTPLLHTFRSEEIPGFGRRGATGVPTRVAGAKPGAAAPGKPVGVPASTATKAGETLGQTVAAAPVGADARPARPARSVMDDGAGMSTGQPVAAAAKPSAAASRSLPPGSSPGAGPAKGSSRAAARTLVQRLRSLRGRMQELSRSMQRCQDELLVLMAQHGLDEAVLDGVVIRRLPGGPQGWKLKLQWPEDAAGGKGK